MHLKADLPKDLRGDAIPELLRLLSEREDDAGLREVLKKFGDDLAHHVSELSDDMLAKLHALAPSEKVSSMLAQELACSMAKMKSAAGVKSLWQILKRLAATCEAAEAQSGQWCAGEACGLFLAAHPKFKADLKDLPLAALRSTNVFMTDASKASARAMELFRCDLGLPKVKSDASVLAQVLLERSKREEKAQKQKLLMEAYELDESDAEIRTALIQAG